MEDRRHPATAPMRMNAKIGLSQSARSPGITKKRPMVRGKKLTKPRKNAIAGTRLRVRCGCW
jgi:hypothetical protein